MRASDSQIIEAFWHGVDDDATWGDLNEGMDVTFYVNWQEYTVSTRLGNYWSMGVDAYQEMIEQRAVNAVRAREEVTMPHNELRRLYEERQKIESKYQEALEEEADAASRASALGDQLDEINQEIEEIEEEAYSDD